MKCERVFPLRFMRPALGLAHSRVFSITSSGQESRRRGAKTASAQDRTEGSRDITRHKEHMPAEARTGKPVRAAALYWTGAATGHRFDAEEPTDRPNCGAGGTL